MNLPYKFFKDRMSLRVVVLAITLIFSVLTGAFSAPIDLPKDSNGWTIFTPSVDSRIVYVSNSGNDSTGTYYSPTDSEIGNDPFNPVGPLNTYASYAAAYSQTRNGYPDWILVHRGDEFLEAIGNQIRDGRNGQEPFVIAAYGSSGLSPVFKTGANRGLSRINTGIEWFAMSGISLYAHTRDPDSVNFVNTDGGSGFDQYVRPGEVSQGVLFEGCKFRYYTSNTLNNNNGSIIDIVFRRCLFLDNYSAGGSHSQGFWASGAEITLEECVFDHNGWYSQNGSGLVGEATMFNHNTYFYNTRNTAFRDNMFMRASSMNNKWTTSLTGGTSNITIDNNLYVDGEIGIGIGSNYTVPLRFRNITISNNVITNIGRSQPTNRTLGWGLRIEAWDGGSIRNNYILNQPWATVNNTYGMAFRDTIRNVRIANNTIHNVRFAHGIIFDDGDGVDVSNMVIEENKIQIPQNSKYIMRSDYDLTGKWTIRNNVYYSDRSSASRFRIESEDMTLAQWAAATGDNSTFEEFEFPDATRSIETYQASLGATPTIDAFIVSCRAQDRFNWDENYTAKNVNRWIKAGYYVSTFPWAQFLPAIISE